MSIKLKAVLLLAGKTATGFCIPDEVVAELGKSKKPPVKVTVNGHTWRSTIASMGGTFMLGVRAEIREITGIKANDEVEIELELDTEKREVDVPEDFRLALAGNIEASHFFDQLSFSNKQGYVLPIIQAKTDETRQRRISKALQDLAAQKK